MISVNKQMEDAFVAIITERNYQNEGRGNSRRHEGMPEMTPGEMLLCMKKLLDDAIVAWYAPDGGSACLPHVRKIGAMSVKCMEVYGAPIRNGRSQSRLHLSP